MHYYTTVSVEILFLSLVATMSCLHFLIFLATWHNYYYETEVTNVQFVETQSTPNKLKTTVMCSIDDNVMFCKVIAHGLF